MCNYFRTLRADEIEVRVQQIKKNNQGKAFTQLLLYKDARVDMTLLDEEFGIFGWQREHSFKDGKSYCRISVYDKETNRWVVKEDAGASGDIEKEKSEASSSFKRAATNLGIGRELYSSPYLSINLEDGEYYQNGTDKNGNPKLYLSYGVSFRVNAIDYDERRNIVAIEIVDNAGRTRKKIGNIHTALFQAKAEMNAARTLQEARSIWKKYPEFHEDTGFYIASKTKADHFADRFKDNTNTQESA